MDSTDFFLLCFVAVVFFVLGALVGMLVASVVEARYRPETAQSRPEKPRKAEKVLKRKPVAVTDAMALQMELEEQGRNRL